MGKRHDPVLPFVEAILAREDITPTSFGLNSIGDPRLVADLRSGRELRRSTRERVFAFISLFALSDGVPIPSRRPSRKETAHV